MLQTDRSLTTHAGAVAVLALESALGEEATGGWSSAASRAWAQALPNARLERGLSGVMFIEPAAGTLAVPVAETWQLPLAEEAVQAAQPMQAALTAVQNEEVSFALVCVQGAAPGELVAIVLCRQALCNAQRLAALGSVAPGRGDGSPVDPQAGGGEAAVLLRKLLPRGWVFNPAEPFKAGTARERYAHLLCLSAPSIDELDIAQRGLAADVGSRANAGRLADVAFTLHVSRTHGRHRRCIVARDAEHAGRLLAVTSTSREGDVIHDMARDEAPRWAWICTDAPVAVEAAFDLYETHADFRRTFNRCDRLLRPVLVESLLATMRNSPLADWRPPVRALSTAVVGLCVAELLRSWGLRPAAVCGQGPGVVAAMYAAGACDLDAAMELAAAIASSAGTPEHAARFRAALTAPGIDLRRCAGLSLGSAGSGRKADPLDLWVKQLQGQISANDVFDRVAASGCDTLLELAADVAPGAASQHKLRSITALQSACGTWVALGRLVGQAWAEGAEVDLLAWDRGYVRSRLCLTRAAAISPPMQASARTGERPSMLAGARALKAPRLRRALVDALALRIAELIGIPLEEALPDQKFFTLGMQSLHAVTLTRELELELGCELGNTLLFEHPTIERLAGFLASRLPQAPAPACDARPVVAESGDTSLSGDALRAALIGELAR